MTYRLIRDEWAVTNFTEGATLGTPRTQWVYKVHNVPRSRNFTYESIAFKGRFP